MGCSLKGKPWKPASSLLKATRRLKMRLAIQFRALMTENKGVKEPQDSLKFWTDRYAQIEAAVISGQHQEARKLLNLVSPKTLPREWAYQFAQLASRIHHSIYSLKVLHRFVAPENPLAVEATPPEKMIYAYALCNLSATEEALELLNSFNGKDLPEAQFLKALTYVRQWNYSQSIPLLKDYLASPNLEPYRRLVGELNLVAAYVSTGDWEQASPWLEKIQATCQEAKYQLVLGNSFELKAQVLFFQGHYDEALVCLEQARELLKDQKGLYLLFVEKWTLICQVFKNRSAENLERLRELKLKAGELADAETVRECELFEAVATQNEALLRKVIMGTPSEHYRQRARQLFGKNLKPLGQFAWALSPGSAEATAGEPVTFDPYEKQNSQEALYEKPQLLAVFEALTLDFYKPCHLGALFKSVYPQEKFNPYTSPARVLQLLKRLDLWFQDQAVPLRVDFKKSEFSVTALVSVRIPIQRGKKMSFSEGHWREIKNIFEGRTFTTSKISEVVGISKTSAQRLVKEALKEGRVKTVGRGRSTTYQFSSRRKEKLAA
jgi:tetratricopeptide (TPR) repeat protein